MYKVLDFFSNNPWFGVSGWLASILGVILTIVFFRIQMKKKIISFSYTTNELIGGKLAKIDELDIFYKGASVKKLSVTSVKLTNTGNGFIENTDFHEGLETSFIPKGNFNVLFANVMNHDSNDSIHCEEPTITEEGIVYLRFKCLDEKETILLNIYHTGDESSEFEVAGKIKGGKIINKTRGSEIVFKMIMAIDFAVIATILIGSVLIGLLIQAVPILVGLIFLNLFYLIKTLKE